MLLHSNALVDFSTFCIGSFENTSMPSQVTPEKLHSLRCAFEATKPEKRGGQKVMPKQSKHQSKSGGDVAGLSTNLHTDSHLQNNARGVFT
eukprot:SAG31_NODE_1163_length_9588_cov_8.265676_3_plen_91_part_00